MAVAGEKPSPFIKECFGGFVILLGVHKRSSLSPDEDRFFSMCTIPLQLQQLCFHVQSAAIASKCPVFADYPMAGDGD